MPQHRTGRDSEGPRLCDCTGVGQGVLAFLAWLRRPPWLLILYEALRSARNNVPISHVFQEPGGCRWPTPACPPAPPPQFPEQCPAGEREPVPSSPASSHRALPGSRCQKPRPTPGRTPGRASGFCRPGSSRAFVIMHEHFSLSQAPVMPWPPQRPSASGCILTGKAPLLTSLSGSHSLQRPAARVRGAQKGCRGHSLTSGCCSWLTFV